MSGYLGALRGLGVHPVADQALGSYQGDIVALVRFCEDDIEYSTWDSDDPVGFVVIGYGSCSGCDSWQGADTAEERLDILERMVKSIKWFPNLGEAKAYVLGVPVFDDDGVDQYGGRRWDRQSDHPNPLYRDHELEWYGHETGWTEFMAAVRELKSDY